MQQDILYILIIISIVIIFSCAYFKSLKEGLTNNDTVILMGDSVLNNDSYVPSGKSVYDSLGPSSDAIAAE